MGRHDSPLRTTENSYTFALFRVISGRNARHLSLQPALAVVFHRHHLCLDTLFRAHVLRVEKSPLPPLLYVLSERSRLVHAILLSVHVSSHPQRQKLGSASEGARVGNASGVGASTLTGTNGRLVDMKRAQSVASPFLLRAHTFVASRDVVEGGESPFLSSWGCHAAAQKSNECYVLELLFAWTHRHACWCCCCQSLSPFADIRRCDVEITSRQACPRTGIDATKCTKYQVHVCHTCERAGEERVSPHQSRWNVSSHPPLAAVRASSYVSSSWHLRRVSPPVNSLEAFDLGLFICANRNAGGHGIAASTPEVVQLWYGNQKGDGGAHQALKLDNNFCLVITLRNKEAKVSERRCCLLCSVAFLLDLAVGV